MRKRCIIGADNVDDELIVGETRNGDDINWRLDSFVRSGASLILLGVEKELCVSADRCRVSGCKFSFKSFCTCETFAESMILISYPLFQ